MSKAYINKITKFLPNDPVTNDEMESVLGMVGGKPSKARALTLRSNKIKTRYYALKDGKATHTNAQLAAEAIKQIFKEGFDREKLELIACGTTGPDQLLSSHASIWRKLRNCYNDWRMLNWYQESSFSKVFFN
ncbi:MAG: hypothetical protein BGO76_08845 [Caedibacter sp. 38-128]|nr:hypothetical protein [Holosporales bacterium]OJX08889.1 MAG: hypothetical protein BGO76_08845 [Caedibacter sp. 38-128]